MSEIAKLPRAPHKEKAAAHVEADRSGPTVRLPVVGSVDLPPLEHMIWYVGVAVMTAVELIEWPIALLVSAGKVLADNRHNTTLQKIGEVLEEAG